MEKEAVREFVGLRCPVFRRRDRALRKFGQSPTTTFDEAWDAVMECSSPDSAVPHDNNDTSHFELGVEGWMVLCRLIALAQYQEAKRRFSERHSQQTMRHKTGGTEVVLVDVLPPNPPEPLNSNGLAQHHAESATPLTLPEMDLDHCLLSAHDVSAERDILVRRGKRARVEVKVFGSTKIFGSTKGGSSSLLPSPSAKGSKLDFVVTFYPTGDGSSSPIVVRRSFADMMWLYETFALHKKPGGTLCGRILPPFPSASSRRSESSDEIKTSITGSVVAAGSSAAVAAASAGVGMITSVAKSAKSLLGGYVSSSSGTCADAKKSDGGKMGRNSGWNYGREDSIVSASDKAGQVERYLNYLLEHPALSTSFPLNVILKVSLTVIRSKCIL